MLRASSLVLVLLSVGCAESAVSTGSGGSGESGGAGTASGGNAGSAGAEAGRAGSASSGQSNGESGGSNASGGSAGSDSIGGAKNMAGAEQGGSSAGDTDASLLIFSRTAAYRHDSIPAGIEALTRLASEHGWKAAATEDGSQFTDSGLAGYDAVIFLSTTGDVLNDEQQAAFERFIRAGHGFVGIHAASDTEYDWPWYGELVGAYFREHPSVQAADVVVEDASSAATSGLPKRWNRTDEWYSFRENPRQNVHVLLSLDEGSYDPGASNMAGDHPVAWYHEHDGGRAFYTALGHTNESYADPLFLGHVAGGIGWVLGLH